MTMRNNFCFLIALTVEFEQLSYSAVEGQNIVFNVVLSEQTDTQVMVEFSTQDDTAIG